MKAVRFLDERTVQRKGGPTYAMGSVHFLREDQVRHWLNRGAVEVISDEEANAALGLDPEVPAEEQEEQEELEIAVEVEETEVEVDEPALEVLPEEVDNGEALDSSPDVEGKDGGDTGERAEPVAPTRGRRRKS